MSHTDQNKMPSVNIYLIKRETYDGKRYKLNAVCKEIIDSHNNSSKVSNESEKYRLCKIKSKYKKQCRLFHQERTAPLRWSDYLQPVLTESVGFKNTINSFILFLLVEDLIFAVVGGQGYHVISKHTDNEFSKSIIEKTFDKTSSVFKYLQDHSLVGNIIGTSKLFRNDSNLAVEEDYGKLFEKVIAYMDADQLEQLGLKDRKRGSCFAGSGFRLSTSISIDETIILCQNLNDRLKKESKMNLNDVEEEKDIAKIKEVLEPALLAKIRELTSDDYKGDDFEFLNKDIFRFSMAEALSIRQGRSELVKIMGPTTSASDVLKKLRSVIGNCADDKELKKLLDSVRVISYNESVKAPVTEGSLLDHLNAEILIDDKEDPSKNGVWFLVNGKWFKLTRDIVAELNRYLENNFQNVTEEWMDKTYNKQDIEREYKDNKDSMYSHLSTSGIPYELIYNLQYADYPNTLVLDRVFYDNSEKVELCDIMQIQENTLVMVHVKKGFGASTRVVAEQIVSSANVLALWRKNPETAKVDPYYEELVETYTKYNGRKTNVNKAAFREAILKSGKVQYVLAFITKGRGNFKFASHRSVLAKIAIMNATKRIAELGFEMKLIRIRETKSSAEKRK